MSHQLSQRRMEMLEAAERYVHAQLGPPHYDHNDVIPNADAVDISNGAQFIPPRVTTLRDLGYRVEFIHNEPGKYHWIVLSTGELIYF